MRFVVIGTGRCGTTWLSDVLTEAGVLTSHEHMFSPTGYQDRWWRQTAENESLNYQGDVSLYALPVLEGGMRRFDGTIVHLTRNPLDCIGSLAGWALPSHPNKQGVGGRFVNDNLQFTVAGNQVRNSAKYWVEWNYRCRAISDFQIKVEDLDAEHLSTLAADLGHDVTVGAASSALATYLNYDYSAFPTRPDMYRRLLDWEDIPDPEPVRVMASELGY